MENWSQDKKNKFTEEAARLNKVWGKKNELERREKNAHVLGFEKDKSEVNNSEVLIIKDQSSTSKFQKI